MSPFSSFGGCAEFQSCTTSIEDKFVQLFVNGSSLHQHGGKVDANTSWSASWGCTVWGLFDCLLPRHPTLLSFSVGDFRFVKLTPQVLYSLVGFVSEKYHHFPLLLKFATILVLMTIGWSLILFALYHPYFANVFWKGFKVKKRRYTFNRTWYVNAMSPEISNGRRLPWRKSRTKWKLCAPFLYLTVIPSLNAMQLNEQTQQPAPFDVFTPQAWSDSMEQTPQSNMEPYREIFVHQLDVSSSSFRMSTLVPLWTIREAIGLHRGLHRRQDHWNNFNIYQVQPQPSSAANPLDLHYVMEMPNDRLPCESLILVEKKEIRPSFNSQVSVWRVKNAIARDELIHEVGSEHECGERLDKCLLFVLGDLWHPQHTYIRVVPNGALVKVMYSLDDQDDDCSGSSSDSHSSRRVSNGEAPSTRPSSDTTSPFEDDLSLMQRPSSTLAPTRNLERHLSDGVFRLLEGRRSLLGITEDRAFGVHLWALRRTPSMSSEIARAWLEPTLGSWERRCTEVSDAERGVLREDSGVWNFFLATPTPPALTFRSPNINLLCLDADVTTGTRALLVDVFHQTWTRRVAVTFFETDSVFMLAVRVLDATFQQLDDFIFQICWSTGDGDIILHDHDSLTLPSGAYVELSRHEREEIEHCSFLQTSTVHRAPCDFSTAFWPYGRIGTSAFFDDCEEGLTPTTSFPSSFLWSSRRTNAFVSKKHQTSFLTRRNFQWLSFARSPVAGLRPPGNPNQTTDMDVKISPFDTLDVHDVNEGVPSVCQTVQTASHLKERILQVATPARSLCRPQEEGEHKQDPKRIPEFFSIADDDGVSEGNCESLSDVQHAVPQQRTLDTKAEDEIFDEILFFDPDLHRLHQNFADCELHPASTDWLSRHSWAASGDFDPFNYRVLQVHTDGSFNGQSSAWCFVVTAINEAEVTTIIGFAAAKVVLDRKHPAFAGTTRHGASQSEVEALHWASWWLARCVIAHGWTGRVLFKWDSQTAGSKAQGLADNVPSVTHGPTAARLRSFQHLLTQWLGWDGVQHEHTKAHSGEPLNELADVLSKFVNTNDIDWSIAFPPPSQIEILSPHAFELLWYYVSPDSWKDEVFRELPPMRDGIVQWQTTSEPATEDPSTLREWASMMSPFSEAEGKNKVETHFKVLFASYDVLSLGNNMATLKSLHDEPGRIALLRQQAHERGIHFLGVQEARTPQGSFSSATHFRYSAGAHAAGHGGVELWVSKLAPFARTTCGKLCFLFTQSHFHVQFADPSILLVTTENCELELLLGVLHAPHTGHPEASQHEWWTRVRELLHSYGRSRQIVLLMDANAKIGHHVDHSFGGYTIDLENKNGGRLRQLASEFALCAPASFA